MHERERSTGPDLALRISPVLICLVLAGNVVAMRLALTHLPPFRTSAIRMGLAAITVAVWVWALRGRMRLPVHRPRPLAVMSGLTTGIFALLYAGLERTTASHGSVILYLYPIFTALIAHRYLTDERMTLRRASSLALGFLGAVLTISDVQLIDPHAGLVGDLLVAGSALLWAINTIYTKRVVQGADPYSLVFYPSVASAAAFLAMSLAFEPPFPSSVSRTTALALAYQGVLVAGATRIAWILLIRRLQAGVLAAYTFLTPVFGVLGGALFLGESLSVRLMVGLLLVATALLMIDHRPSVRAAPAISAANTSNSIARQHARAYTSRNH